MLHGLRVIDLSRDVAGAYATRCFAALGADVIKVEPPEGDPTRFLPPRAGPDPDQGILYAYLNASKRSVVVDCDDPEQRGRLLQLLSTADLIVESGAPGEWASRGVDFQALLAAQPRLVICSITPFGQDGPRACWRTTALTAFASGGQMMLCGEPDLPPLKTAGHQAYYQAGLHGFAASVTALLAVARSGSGDWIDISIQEAQAASLEAAGPAAMAHDRDLERTGNQARAVWGIYPCEGGYVGVASMARQVGSIYRCIGHPELLEDPRYSGSVLTAECNDILSALIQAWTSERDPSAIYAESQRFRAPFSLIPTPAELLAWPSLQATGFWTLVDHPVLGQHTLAGLPFTVDGDRGRLQRAPLLGEHTEAVLREGGLPADRGVRGSGATLPTQPPHQGGSPPKSPRPLLDGIRVLDLTQVWAGPYAARFFADMGADVIHIEGPSFPDAVRAVGRGSDPRGFNKSAYFNEYNRNKRGLTLDLHRPEGLAAFYRLVATADVVIENWSAGVAERLGAGYEDLRALNPAIIFVQMPGFGTHGPESERVGFGPTIEQMGGLVALQGYEGGPPHKSGISYGDPTGGIIAAGATALALLQRERTGSGSHVIVTQRDNIIGLIGEYVAAESLGLPMPLRTGNADAEYAPHGVYRTRDDSGRMQFDPAGNPLREFHDTWLAIAVDSDTAWRALCDLLGDPRLNQPAYDTAAGRRAEAAAIDAVLAAWARDRDPAEAAGQLQEVGVSAVPVLSPLMLVRDPHLRARANYLVCDHPDAGANLTARPVWRLKQRPLQQVRPAPCFGEHNAEILEHLAGFGIDKVAGFAAAGITAESPVATKP